ncbi:MAG: hypothetical protein CL662_08400 [Bacteroidetes bacterium]|nr:hypothetical protein [Bacteroidota bacterium]|tara:strand:+ start:4012 stop:4434 length:423 start_codon:yes stop_codon:yes gene_type:complete
MRTISLISFVLLMFVLPTNSNAQSESDSLYYYPYAYDINIGPVEWVEEEEAGYYFRIIFSEFEIYKSLHIEYMWIDAEGISKKILFVYNLSDRDDFKRLNRNSVKLLKWKDKDTVTLSIDDRKYLLLLSNNKNEIEFMEL